MAVSSSPWTQAVDSVVHARGALPIALLLAGHFLFLAAFFAPAISTPDANGYMAQARLIARQGRTDIVVESPAQYVGDHWMPVADGEYYGQYPPGLPALLALVFRPLGWYATLWVIPILGSLSLLGLYLVVRDWVGPEWALLAAVLMAVNPFANKHALGADSHTAVCFFLIWALYALVRWERSRAPGWAALVGFCLGVIPSIRYAETLFLVPFVVYVLASPPRGGRWWRSMLTALVCASVPLIALAVRNQVAFGAFWKTGYSVSGEQTVFGLGYFVRHAIPYLVMLLILGVALHWGLPYSTIALYRLKQENLAIARVTRAVQEHVQPGSVLIAQSGLLQHLDYLGDWRLAPEEAFERPVRHSGPRGPGAQWSEEAAEPGSSPAGYARGFLGDIARWAGPAGQVYWLTTADQLQAIRARLGPEAGHCEPIAEVHVDLRRSGSATLRRRFSGRAPRWPAPRPGNVSLGRAAARRHEPSGPSRALRPSRGRPVRAHPLDAARDFPRGDSERGRGRRIDRTAAPTFAFCSILIERLLNMFILNSGGRLVRFLTRSFSRTTGVDNRPSGRSRHQSSCRLVERLERRELLATLMVSTLADSGPGSLRAEISQGNVDTSPDTITFGPGVVGTIVLVSPLPDLSATLSIMGPGSSALAVARSSAFGTPSFRIFSVAQGARVVMSGLTITGGSFTAVPPTGTDGAGIHNAGVLTLSGCTIENNSSSGNGGGILNSGTLSLIDSSVSGNSAGFEGGGIESWGTLTVKNSMIGNNTAGTSGGGINSNYPGSLNLVGSTVSGNMADGTGGRGGGVGGGIFSEGPITVSNSTLSDNTAIGEVQYGGGAGGGIICSNPPFGLTITGSTVSGNKVVTVGGVSGFTGQGGGIWCGNAPLLMTNCTVSGNSAFDGGGILGSLGRIVFSTISDNSATRGGGIALSELQGPVLTLGDSLLSNPQGGNLALSFNSNGSYVSLGHNLFSDVPPIALAATDLVNTNPLLGPLGDHGGPTFTRALLPGSPAIDAGVTIGGVLTDQRGIFRPQGKAPDIGAFEVEATSPTVILLQRLGVHDQPTSLLVTFSLPIDPMRAEDLANYRLVWSGPDAKFGTRDGRLIPIVTARYDAATQTVTLRPRWRLPLRDTFRLTVVGTPPGGLATPTAAYLAGSPGARPGTNYVARITGKLLSPPIEHPRAQRAAAVREHASRSRPGPVPVPIHSARSLSGWHRATAARPRARVFHPATLSPLPR